jgi:hypothetical protein
MNQTNVSLPFRLLAEVTFHYSEKRLHFLFQSIRGLCEMPVEELQVVVSTNTRDENALSRIRTLCGPLFDGSAWGGANNKTLLIESFPNLTDPWLLPWCHKHLIVDSFLAKGSSFTHFIHIEDDLLLSVNNLLYFTRYAEQLRPQRLIPAFQRIEYNHTQNELRLLDQIGLADYESSPKVSSGEIVFVNPDYPHQAMFILDRVLAEEYVQSRSFDSVKSVDVRPSWGLCERASMGLCFESPPAGYWSRYVIPVDATTRRSPSWSWIYHLPNNYTDNQRTSHGKTRPEAQFSTDRKAIAWFPPTRFQNLVWRIRQLPSQFLRGPRKTGHDLVPPGLCGKCGNPKETSSQCTRASCPVIGHWA